MLGYAFRMCRHLMASRPCLGIPGFMLQNTSLEQACALPVCGERWFKKGKLPPDLCNKFLVLEHQDPDWSQGIPVAWIKEDWKGALTTVQRYITGEGRFNIVHCYHLCFLMHLSGDREINLPYYLLKSLTKMARRVQGHPESAHRSLYHQGLIKLLVTFLSRNLKCLGIIS
jgi:hypothetical protein